MAVWGDEKLRLRFVHNFDVLPIKIRLGDATVVELKSRIRPFLEAKCGKRIELASLSLLHCETPLRDVDGCALRGVKDQALVECIATRHTIRCSGFMHHEHRNGNSSYIGQVAAPDEAAAANAQAARVEANLLARVEDVNSDVDTLENQERAGSFQGKPTVLLEALERQLYSLDKIRAAAGEKLSPQVMGARKVATRRINDLHAIVERQGCITVPSQMQSAAAATIPAGSSEPQQPAGLMPLALMQSNDDHTTRH